MPLQDYLLYILAYVLGGIPFSVLIGRLFYKVDVRKHGSGNPGATNMLRTLGPRAGLTVLLLDILKGVAAVLLVRWLSDFEELTRHERMIIAGSLAILGHVYSPFLNFKGGKGVATTVGVLISLEPGLGVAAIGIFTVILFTTHYVSLGSIIACFGFTILVLLLRAGEEALIVFSLGVTALIVVKHKANIQRLLRGEENRFALRKKD